MRNEKVDFSSPTSSRWEKAKSVSRPDLDLKRPALASQDEIQKNIAASKDRKPFVALVSDDTTRSTLGLPPDTPINDWHRGLASMITASPANVRNFETMMADKELDPKSRLRSFGRPPETIARGQPLLG